jgi:uncharacterized protein (TIGR03435 family)
MRGIDAIPMSLLIQVAYNVKEFQILGAPSWAKSDRYDVDARAEGDATIDQMRPMLQSLLTDRFRLTLRRETRQVPVYELVPFRNGLKIAPTKEGGCISPDQAKPFAPLNICGGWRQGWGRLEFIEAVAVPMAKLIELLSDKVGRPVLDKTGFTEPFNFRLEFEPNILNADTPVVPNSSGVSIFTAVEEQLGLKLESTRGPVDVLVIDHVERPTPD